MSYCLVPAWFAALAVRHFALPLSSPSVTGPNPRSKIRMAVLFAGLLITASTVSAVSADIVEYTAGHADIRPVYENGELSLKYRFDVGAVLNGAMNLSPTFSAPHEAYVRVPDSTTVNPSDPTAALFFTFFPNMFISLGSPTEPFWALPQNNVPGQPFFGFSTEELAFADWTTNFAVELTNFNGPGHFALYQSGFPPTVHLSTANADDTFAIFHPGHDHYNWTFLKAGIYELEFTVTGTHVTDGVKSATGSFTFAVGNATAVPEASSLLLCGLAGAAAVSFRSGWQRVARRRRERSACAARG